MPAMEVITVQTTAPDTAAFVAGTIQAGNSLTIRDMPQGARAWILQAWMDAQGKAGVAKFRVTSPRMHDNVQGMRFDVVVSEVDPCLPWGVPTPVYANDTIVVGIEGSATGGDIETVSLLIYYEQLDGIDAHLAHLSEIKPRVKNLVSIETAVAMTGAGGYTGQVKIVNDMDVLKADTEYALLGYLVDVECATVRWQGSNTGNLGVGGPGNELDHQLTNDWFAKLSTYYDLATIPVINSNNRNSVLVDGVQDENGADTNLISILAELS